MRCGQPPPGSLCHTSAPWSCLGSLQGLPQLLRSVPPGITKYHPFSLPTAAPTAMPGRPLQSPASSFAPSRSSRLQTRRKTQTVSTEGEGKGAAGVARRVHSVGNKQGSYCCCWGKTPEISKLKKKIKKNLASSQAPIKPLRFSGVTALSG